MERERFDFPPSRDFGGQDGPSDDESFDAREGHLESILRRADHVMDRSVNAQGEQQLQQLRQRGAE